MRYSALMQAARLLDQLQYEVYQESYQQVTPAVMFLVHARDYCRAQAQIEFDSIIGKG